MALLACCTGGHGTVRRVHTLNKTLLQQAVFVPPGYTSLLYAHGHEDNSCPYNTALFKVSTVTKRAGSPTACMPKYTFMAVPSPLQVMQMPVSGIQAF